jgi:co-chaperonin GroES (HSP10)
MKLNGKPLRREILVTLDKEEKVNESGLILDVKSIKSGLSGEGFLKDEQTVIAAGSYVDEAKPGMKVLVNFDRYKHTKPTSQMEQTKEVSYNIPTLEFENITYGRIQETDIIWIFD